MGDDIFMNIDDALDRARAHVATRTTGSGPAIAALVCCLTNRRAKARIAAPLGAAIFFQDLESDQPGGSDRRISLFPAATPSPTLKPERDRGTGADERQQPYDRRCDESRASAGDDGCQRTLRRIHVTKPTRDEVLRLRKPYDHRCR